MTVQHERPVPAHDSRSADPGPDDFRAVFRRHPAGVAVVALADGTGPVGFTATSVISVSADPPLLAFSVAGTSSSWPALREADTVAVSLLTADQADVSRVFATSGADRFAAVPWTRLATGEPVIDGASAWLRARVLQRLPVGSSHLVTAEALAAWSGDDDTREPLVYHDRAYRRLVPPS